MEKYVVLCGKSGKFSHVGLCMVEILKDDIIHNSGSMRPRRCSTTLITKGHEVIKRLEEDLFKCILCMLGW
jgi:hypothetical protein